MTENLEPLEDPPVGEELDTDPDHSLRVAALQFASMTVRPETPIEEFLSKAAKVEDYIRHGNVSDDKES